MDALEYVDHEPCTLRVNQSEKLEMPYDALHVEYSTLYMRPQKCYYLCAHKLLSSVDEYLSFIWLMCD
jgi:hypothetical protein